MTNSEHRAEEINELDRFGPNLTVDTMRATKSALMPMVAKRK